MAAYYISIDSLIWVSIGIGLIMLFCIIISITKSLKINKEFKHLHWHAKHSHYWIENEILYESYATHRGLRHLELLDLPGFEDTDNCDEQCIAKIEELCQKSVN